MVKDFVLVILLTLWFARIILGFVYERVRVNSGSYLSTLMTQSNSLGPKVDNAQEKC